MGRGNKKSFAVAAIIVGAVGVGIGVYSIAAVTSSMQNENTNGLNDGLNDLAAYSYNTLGPADATITIIEYADFQCPNCMRFATQVRPALAQGYIDDGKVKLIFRDFPILGADSLNGAMASHCAGEQGRFWEMHDSLYEKQGMVNAGWLSTDTVKKFASDLALDTQQFDACLDGKKYAARIQTNLNEAKAAGATGTPTFLISDGKVTTIVRGAQPLDVFEQVLDVMLEGTG